MISQAFAAHFVPPSESPAEAIALSIILAAGIGLFLVHLGYKKWRRNHPRYENDEDTGEE